jgi:hypothetical protein
VNRGELPDHPGAPGIVECARQLFVSVATPTSPRTRLQNLSRATPAVRGRHDGRPPELRPPEQANTTCKGAGSKRLTDDLPPCDLEERFHEA